MSHILSTVKCGAKLRVPSNLGPVPAITLSTIMFSFMLDLDHITLFSREIHFNDGLVKYQLQSRSNKQTAYR